MTAPRRSRRAPDVAGRDCRPDRGGWSGQGVHPVPVSLAPVVRLSKHEVFAACQALADADRCLIRTGHCREADALGDLFERLESRLAVALQEQLPHEASDDPRQPREKRPQSSFGRYSSEREFTQ